MAKSRSKSKSVSNKRKTGYIITKPAFKGITDKVMSRNGPAAAAKKYASILKRAGKLKVGGKIQIEIWNHNNDKTYKYKLSMKKLNPPTSYTIKDASGNKRTITREYEVKCKAV